MRSTLTITLTLAVQLAAAGFGNAQKVPGDKPNSLRDDKALQVAVQVEGHQKLHDLLGKLREATGLNLAVDASLHDHDADLGHFQASKRGYRAWQIMGLIANRDLQNGYWEKIEGGYCLHGTSLIAVPKTPVEPAREQGRVEQRGVGLTTWLLILIASLLIVLLVLVFLLRKAIRRNERVPAKLP